MNPIAKVPFFIWTNVFFFFWKKNTLLHDLAAALLVKNVKTFSRLILSGFFIYFREEFLKSVNFVSSIVGYLE